jgi:hypothetical protein
MKVAKANRLMADHSKIESKYIEIRKEMRCLTVTELKTLKGL